VKIADDDEHGDSPVMVIALNYSSNDFAGKENRFLHSLDLNFSDSGEEFLEK
jgi:hypothetical protein